MKTKIKKNAALILIGFFMLTINVNGCLCDDDDDSADTGVNLPVTLLQTTDMHSRVSGFGIHNDYTPLNTLDSDSVLGGFSRLAAVINAVRMEQSTDNVPVLLVDSGDFLMGTVYDLLYDTDPASMRFIDTMEYDAVTLGNHEFDYGPADLSVMINAAINDSEGFDIPIVATNTVFDGAGGTDDDGLEELKTSGNIVETYIKELDNGLKVGIIGLMGSDSDSYAPNAVPVTFNSDYTDSAVIEEIQQKVDDLDAGTHVIIALSHSGILGPNGVSPTGDCITLAENITGIDIIASGHEHVKTDNIVEVANGSHTTRIICAGSYTTNLARLDFTVNTSSEMISGLTLTNYPIDDTIEGDSAVNTLVGSMNSTLDTIINTLTSGNVSQISVTVADASSDLPAPTAAYETGLGNLIADGLRFAGTEAGTLSLSAYPNGTIRGYFSNGQDISFADLFSVLPLGMTKEDDQDPKFPGYSLLKVYLTRAEIADMCQFIALIIAAQDDTFDPVAAGFPDGTGFVLSQMSSSYFLNLSGIQYSYDSDYLIIGINVYAHDDYDCNDTGSVLTLTTAYPNATDIIPLIVDSYLMDMLMGSEMQLALSILQLSIDPKLDDGTTEITADNMDQARLDKDATEGVQEYQPWSAVLEYITDAAGLNGTIPAASYGTAAPDRVVTP